MGGKNSPACTQKSRVPIAEAEAAAPNNEKNQAEKVTVPFEINSTAVGQSVVAQGENTSADLVRDAIEAITKKDEQTDNLSLAFASKDYEMILSILREGPVHLDEKTPLGETFLHLACEGGQAGVVEELIKSGASLNSLTNSGNTPLMLAINNGHLEVVKLMVRNGADVNIGEPSTGRLPLHTASELGSLEIVKCLVEEGGADASAEFEIVETHRKTAALNLATENSHLLVVEYLVSKGVPLGNIGRYPFPPLLIALFKKNFEIAKCIINAETAEGIEASCNKMNPVAIAAQDNNLELVQLLLAKGLDPNKESSEENTALHYACKNGNLEMVQVLLNAKARVDKRNNLRNLPISLVSGSRSEEIKQLLLQNGSPDPSI